MHSINESRTQLLFRSFKSNSKQNDPYLIQATHQTSLKTYKAVCLTICFTLFSLSPPVCWKGWPYCITLIHNEHIPVASLSACNYKVYMEALSTSAPKAAEAPSAWRTDTTGDEGLAASALYERDYNATRSPPFFHQWKQVITSYPFTSLMGFSAMLRSAVMEHPLMKIHMAGCLKISAIHSSPFFFSFFSRNHWKIRQGFSTRRAKIVCINDICRYGILSRIS